MPRFKYVAMDAKGREEEGVVDAENQARAIAMVREKGLFPTTISEMGARPGAKTPVAAAVRRGGAAEGGAERRKLSFLSRLSGRVRLKNLVIFTRQLATLQNAGLPLLRGLHILQKQEKQPVLKEAIISMAESVEGGSTFAEALAQQPKVFDKFFVNMVKAGEAGGAMEAVLNRLAEFMEKAQRIRSKVKSAMVYPLVVMVTALGILTFLMIVVIPKFEEIFKNLLEGERLPPLTAFVMGISYTVGHHWLTVVLAIAGIVVAFRLLRAASFARIWIDRMKLAVPIFGALFRKAAIANFTRTLGTLLTGGVPVLQALNIVKEIAGNQVISRAVQQVHDSVKEGESMALPLEASGAFPPMVVSMVQVGEETGALPDMLMKIADAYDEEVNTAVEALTSIIEPLLIIFMAFIVGTIVISMFLPLVGIINKLVK